MTAPPMTCGSPTGSARNTAPRTTAPAGTRNCIAVARVGPTEPDRVDHEHVGDAGGERARVQDRDDDRGRDVGRRSCRRPPRRRAAPAGTPRRSPSRSWPGAGRCAGRRGWRPPCRRPTGPPRRGSATSPTSDDPSDSACEPPITTATPANAMSAPASLGAVSRSMPDGRREQRDEDRRRGDEQGGVARADLRQPRRPQHLVAAEPDQARARSGAREARRRPDRALPSPQDRAAA